MNSETNKYEYNIGDGKMEYIQNNFDLFLGPTLSSTHASLCLVKIFNFIF